MNLHFDYHFRNSDALDSLLLCFIRLGITSLTGFIARGPFFICSARLSRPAQHHRSVGSPDLINHAVGAHPISRTDVNNDFIARLEVLWYTVIAHECLWRSEFARPLDNVAFVVLYVPNDKHVRISPNIFHNSSREGHFVG